FSPKVKFFADWLDFDRKFPENQAIYVVIEAADPSAAPSIDQWVQLNERITARLERMPEQVKKGGVVSKIRIDDPKAPAILFDKPENLPDDFEQFKELAPLMPLWGEKPSWPASRLGAAPMGRFILGLQFK